MNYTEMLFNRDERLVNLLNQADNKNLELIEEINDKEDKIERLKIDYQQANEILAEQSEEIKKSNKEIVRLNNIINEFDKWLLGEQMMFYRSSDDERLIRYGKTTNKWLELKRVDKPRKGEVVSLEELESCLPQNTIEEEYDDWFWS